MVELDAGGKFGSSLAAVGGGLFWLSATSRATIWEAQREFRIRPEDSHIAAPEGDAASEMIVLIVAPVGT